MKTLITILFLCSAAFAANVWPGSQSVSGPFEAVIFAQGINADGVVFELNYDRRMLAATGCSLHDTLEFWQKTDLQVQCEENDEGLLEILIYGWDTFYGTGPILYITFVPQPGAAGDTVLFINHLQVYQNVTQIWSNAGYGIITVD